MKGILKWLLFIVFLALSKQIYSISIYDYINATIYCHNISLSKRWIPSNPNTKVTARLLWSISSFYHDKSNPLYWRTRICAAQFSIRNNYGEYFASEMEDLQGHDSNHLNEKFKEEIHSLLLLNEAITLRNHKRHYESFASVNKLIASCPDDRIKISAVFLKYYLCVYLKEDQYSKKSSDSLMRILKQVHIFPFPDRATLLMHTAYFASYRNDTILSNATILETEQLIKNINNSIGQCPIQILPPILYIYNSLSHLSQTDKLQSLLKRIFTNSGLDIHVYDLKQLQRDIIKYWMNNGDYAMALIYSDYLVSSIDTFEISTYDFTINGMLHSKFGDYKTAIEMLNMYDSNYLYRDEFELNALHSRAIAENKMGDNRNSEKHYKLLIDLRKKLYPNNIRDLAKDYLGYSELLASCNRLNEAYFYSELSCRLKQASGDENSTSYCLALLNQGEIEFQKKNVTQALNTLYKSYTILLKDNTRNNVQHLSINEIHLLILEKICDIKDFVSLNKDSISCEEIREILKICDNANTIIDSAYEFACPINEGYIYYHSLRKKIINRSIGCYFLLNSIAKDSENIENALYLSEIAHSIFLYKNKLMADNEITKKEKRIRHRISETIGIISRDLQESSVKYYKSRLKLILAHQELFRRRIIKINPTSNGPFRKISLQKVCKYLNRKALIEYVVSDTIIYLIFFSHTSSCIIKLQNTVEMKSQANELLQLCSNYNNTHKPETYMKFCAIARSLYKTLIGPVDSLLKQKEIIIVPEDYLCNIPFEVLLYSDPDTSNVNYKNLPYFLMKKTIIYNHGIYYHLNVNSCDSFFKNDNTANPIVFYSPHYPDSTKLYNYQKRLPPLSGASKQTQDLCNKYNSLIRAENTSTESCFKTEDKNANIIHFSMHGYYNNTVSNNALIFSSRDHAEDGLLHFWEIMNLEMNTDLVFLATCYSGSGINHPGAGTFSLAYAFIGAGCSSVIASLWNLPDNNPSGIVERFYQNVYEGKSNANALREAKLYNLQHGDNLSSHPYYWAGYVFYGEDKKTRIALRQFDFTYNFDILLVFIVLVLLEACLIIISALSQKIYKSLPPC